MANEHDEDNLRYEEIVRGFELLGISKDEYPSYTDALSFADGFELCSLYSDDEAISSNTSFTANNCLNKNI